MQNAEFSDTARERGSLAVIIPAYNEERTIRAIADGALKATPHVIVIDDGSTDDTLTQLAGLPVRVVRLSRNMGKAAALRRGFKEALALGVDGVVTLDGDGQHRPEDIASLVSVGATAGDRVVIGSRLHDGAKFPRARLIANRIANFWISWAAGHRISDSQSGFRYYPSSLLRALDLSSLSHGGFVFESEILIRAAQRGYLSTSVHIPALYDAVAFRASHFRPGRDITRIVLMVAWSLIRRGMYPMGLYRSLFA
ncbi:MAG: glycosyltransferase family 2 protein [Alphaproteobacteria bacterium]|jgi:glycosyltransferase involved in cell wall biosynthesis|nr:glycosyltransferase family 2 protein [Alphaproteobacteria bacterium]MBO6863603.1 glycosyltransferase family 2 protein [Alphaproteobacteria bacterium]MEC9267532.1 glycosyltransferase family 2 protein [Pseudomonadota bacterium]